MLAVINHKEGTYYPAGLCVDSDDILYVANNYLGVDMFSTSGQYLGHIDVSYSKCIVSDQFGRLYISRHLDGVIICKPYRHYF